MLVEQVFPIFEEGRILKKDTLDMIRDYAPEYLAILGQSYGNGVLGGFLVSGSQGNILVGPGVLKDGDSYFIMKEPAVLPCESYGSKTRIILKKAETQILPDYRIERYSLALALEEGTEPGEFELGRFCLEKGARLRTGKDYKDIYDLATEYNTLNIIHVRYASENGSTLSPCICKMYAKAILVSSKLEPIDIAFAVTCLNSRQISAELMKQYLCSKGRGSDPGEDNFQWYQRLLQIYSQLMRGNEIQKPPGRITGKTVIG